MKILEKLIVTTVPCPWCLAKKGERCHRHDRRSFGIQHGGPCRPHRQCVERYRRRLKALRITKG
jgi:hypothetical protein